jgi:acetyl esterase/lipase
MVPIKDKHARFYISMDSQPENLYKADMSLIMQSNSQRLHTLCAIQTQRSTGHEPNAEFAIFIDKVRIVQNHMDLVCHVSQADISLKRICIKFKHIDREYILRLARSGICWKYIMHLLAAFDRIINHELSWPIKNYENFGDVEFCEVFTSRLFLLVRFQLT